MTITTNFAIIGAAGYVAPKHLRAIEDCGCNLVAATDPYTSVGILDSYSLAAKFFPETDLFYKYLGEAQNRGDERVDWVSICSPNYLHAAHTRMSLLNGANVLCEKPLVLDPRDLDILQDIESVSGRRVYTVLQLRLHPNLIELKKQLQEKYYDVSLTYVTARGSWYDKTWKGVEEKSGGVITNIGIHLLDLLLWLFGSVVDYELHLYEKNRISGIFYLENAKVRWFLSIDSDDLRYVPSKSAYRELLLDGESVDFSTGFTDLHTSVYAETLFGNGFSIEDARPAVELANSIRMNKSIIGSKDMHHIAAYYKK